MTVAEIKSAIDELSLEERAELMRQLHVWEDDEWDEEMNRDAESGKLDFLIKEADSDLDAGRTREMP